MFNDMPDKFDFTRITRNLRRKRPQVMFRMIYLGTTMVDANGKVVHVKFIDVMDCYLKANIRPLSPNGNDRKTK